METQKYKILGCLLLIGAIVVSLGVALADANAGFGETITTAQMASMFGGGWQCPDKDCDTTSGSCPGDHTDCSGGSINDCYNCKSGNGKVCGAEQQEWGWMCVDGTESCNESRGSCNNGLCEDFTGSLPPDADCGTRPDCS